MTTLLAPVRADQAETPCHVPRLENGDYLSREEFERRWDATPNVKRAELIDGVVFLDVTVGRLHATEHSRILFWLGVYWAHHPELEVIDNASVRLPGGHEVQPDAALRLIEGGTSYEDDGVLEGAPEFVFEVPGSSASRDLRRKRELYLEAGVAEYAVWQLFEGRIDWWAAVDGQWVSLAPGPDGVIESRRFPGLRLDTAKLFAGDLAGVLAAVR